MRKSSARLYNTISLVFLGLSAVWVLFVIVMLVR